MTTVFKRIGAGRLVPLAVLSASVGALGFAYIAEIGFGYEPCQLCLYQRIPFALTGIFSLVALSGLVSSPAAGIPGGTLGNRAQAFVIALCGITYLIGAAIALYHVGVEQHWWASAVCGGAPPNTLTFEQMQQSLMRGEPKACDTVDWQLFGISMAGYNIVYSIALAVGCFASTKLLRTPS